ncbi:MAG: hypothetical protein QG614_331 [Patescibacteria group bacterium]|nr:hypothetical protein [Patescibacteria group bacterium]
MKDIRRPSRNLRYNQSSRTAPTIRSSEDRGSSDRVRIVRPVGMGITKPVRSQQRERPHLAEVRHKVEEYETNTYDEKVEGETEERIDDGLQEHNLSRTRRRDPANYYSSARDRILNEIDDNKQSVFRRHSKLFYLLGIFVLGFLLWTFVFNSATITVTPKEEDKKVSSDYVISSSEKNKKIFEVLSFDGTSEMEIARNAKQKVVSKASGELTIFNNFDTNSQKLIKNTRFESKGGKVFRITETITVPGKVGDIPGKVVAKVTADSVGETYNVEAGKWTIPGFKGSSRYDGFYAESYVAMAGGSDSDKMIIAKVDLDNAISQLTAESKDIIKNSVDENVKPDYYFVRDDIVYDVKNNLVDFESGKDDKFRVFVNAKIVSVNKDNLADYLLQKENPSYDGKGVSIKDFDSLKVKYDLNKNKGIDLVNATSVDLTIEGLATFVYKVDATSLKMDLVNKKNSDDMFNATLSKYSSVASAKSKISPFWVSTYPSSVNKIKVEVIK